jgi:hypothetical protein
MSSPAGALTRAGFIGIPVRSSSEGSEAPGNAEGCETSWRVRTALGTPCEGNACPPPKGKARLPALRLRLFSDPGHAFSLESCLSRVSQLLAGDLSYPRVELPGPPGRSV